MIATEQSTVDNAVLVGIDVGATKTHVRVVETPAGHELLDRTVTTSGWQGQDAAARGRYVSRVLSSLGLGAGTMVALMVGAQGADSDHQALALQHELGRLVSCPVLVLNDAHLLGPAAGLSSAIGLVCGTGSIAVGLDRDGHGLYAGGLGWALGDEGGGAGLVRESVRRLLRRTHEGRTDPVLDAALCEASGVDDVTLLPDLMIRLADPIWPQWAPAVVAAFEAGSPVAAEVIRDAVDELVRLVRLIRDRGCQADTVAAAGSILRQVPAIRVPVQQRVLDELGLPMVFPTEPPVRGAVALARQLVAD
ncbi:BadF/BadG/BcrA/BcrD ATPase family protein [Microlunatus panaciterrae]|uniref:N-acetylglucosamine kinase-like BadF-type ATPase n=1 Tax=Microlunatus panaciterrae TaxID=400768 RepID=A0ABS2RFT3_9ACTN|nr:BadF/BadG/BcrA/BcrD ATPase family protein [Microlunatus panaciterrae]MBM7797860.1 N-acetylglucosamine kinase-like BadF-type ATPase [Microlunatus panaciterrae]